MALISDHLAAAIAAVEDQWGDGAAKLHPQIVAALIQASSMGDLKAFLENDIAPEIREIARSLASISDSMARGAGE